jgi:hypothetical protein
MAFEKDPNEIGALWLRTSARGDYMTGEIGGVKVVCWRVKGPSEKAPTWRVLKSVPRALTPVPYSSEPVSTPDAEAIAF